MVVRASLMLQGDKIVKIIKVNRIIVTSVQFKLLNTLITYKTYVIQRFAVIILDIWASNIVPLL